MVDCRREGRGETETVRGVRRIQETWRTRERCGCAVRVPMLESEVASGWATIADFVIERVEELERRARWRTKASPRMSGRKDRWEAGGKPGKGDVLCGGGGDYTFQWNCKGKGKLFFYFYFVNLLAAAVVVQSSLGVRLCRVSFGPLESRDPCGEENLSTVFSSLRIWISFSFILFLSVLNFIDVVINTTQNTHRHIYTKELSPLSFSFYLSSVAYPLQTQSQITAVSSPHFVCPACLPKRQ